MHIIGECSAYGCCDVAQIRRYGPYQITVQPSFPLIGSEEFCQKHSCSGTCLRIGPVTLPQQHSKLLAPSTHFLHFATRLTAVIPLCPPPFCVAVLLAFLNNQKLINPFSRIPPIVITAPYGLTVLRYSVFKGEWRS